MLKRILGTAVLAGGVIAALSGCEVTQISWANHFYIVGSACAPAPLTAGATTLHNGAGFIGTPGTPGGTRVLLGKVFYADLTHDGVQDAAVSLNCYGGSSSHGYLGTEIQVFTRDAKPVERLVPPQKYPDSALPPYFPYGDTGVSGNTLYTGVESYPAGSAHYLASAYDLYRWDWNGHGFTPVNVATTVNLGGAILTLPTGWVAEQVATTANSHSIVPTWCLMPHSAPAPAGPDAANCPIALRAVSTVSTPPQMSVDTPGGLVGNPEYCDPAHSQTVSLVGYQDSKIGARSADYRHWLYVCADGSQWPVEQYVADNVPGYVLYSSHATAAVHAVLTGIAQTAQLPGGTAPLRLSDFGIVRTVTAATGGYQITLDRVVRGTSGLINNNPQTYGYAVPAAAVVPGQSLKVGDLVELATNGTAVTHLQVDPS